MRSWRTLFFFLSHSWVLSIIHGVIGVSPVVVTSDFLFCDPSISIFYLGSGRQQMTKLHPQHLFLLDICGYRSQICIIDFFFKSRRKVVEGHPTSLITALWVLFLILPDSNIFQIFPLFVSSSSTYKIQQISKRQQPSCWTGVATPEPSSDPSSKAWWDA